MTARSYLEIQLDRAWRTRWWRWGSQVANRRLVVWAEVDRSGKVLRGGLFRSSTGVAELDRAIAHWLTSEGLVLPAIEPGVTHRFLLSLP